MHQSLLLVAALGALLPITTASEWPHFLGPHFNSTSSDTGLIRSFPEGGPPVPWSIEIGPGYGGVSVRDGEVYLHDRITGEADLLRVLSLETGEELWTFQSEAPGRLQFPGSRCVPTIEEELVYLQGGFGHLICVDRALHELLWMVDLATDYEAEDPGYGWCQAPLVYEDLVIVAPMAEDTLLVAFDRFSGDEIWRTPGAGSSHSSPMLFEMNGEPQVVFLSAARDDSAPSSNSGLPPVKTHLAGFEPTTGELLWDTDAYHANYPIPVPTMVDNEHLFLTGGYNSGSSLLRFKDGEEGLEFAEVFHHPKGSQVHVGVFTGDHFYVMANENNNHPRTRQKEGGLMCLDREGNEKWRTGDDPFFGRGAMILADGMLIIQDGFSGILRLVEATPQGYKQLAEADLFGMDDRRDHNMWAPMALAEGRLLLRSQDTLKCVDLRKSTAGS